MSPAGFFDEILDQSRVKAEIVEKYFDTWAKIMIATQRRFPQHDQRIGYVDLFAGPGRYESGAISTPVRVMQMVIANPDYRQRLVTIFNDKDEKNVHSLESTLSSLTGAESLKHPPQIWHREVGDEIAKIFESMKTIPLVAFIDPWGYKGLSLRLVNAFLKDWGCDCIFFFNYMRINAGLSNPAVREHMSALFGDERASRLEVELDPLRPPEREATIVNELAMALKAYGHRYVLPFCFKNSTGKRTSHHLILVTKHFKGYDVMKNIMANASSEEVQGVPSFTYLPPTVERQRLLFELSRPLDDLRSALLESYRGRTISTWDLYEEHSVDRPFVLRNYQSVLQSLLAEEKIRVDRAPRKNSFARDIMVTFPRLRG